MTPPVITFEADPKRRYLIDGVEVPSVTTILGVLAKPALPWWGMQTGVDGLCALHRQGVPIPWDDPEGATKLLIEHRLTVNHVRDNAASRGTGVHDALEAWATSGRVPKLSEFPSEERGYVTALAKALIHLDPTPGATEVMVGSTEHGFAGRYDLRCFIDGRHVRLDLKTGKRVYDEALLQLAAYELAAVEMGEHPSDQRLVLRLDREGGFEVVESHATQDMFLGVLRAYQAVQALKKSRPRKKRQKATA
jgi:hypothetical protein